jgi:hypothetical protein
MQSYHLLASHLRHDDRVLFIPAEATRMGSDCSIVEVEPIMARYVVFSHITSL